MILVLGRARAKKELALLANHVAIRGVWLVLRQASNLFHYCSARMLSLSLFAATVPGSRRSDVVVRHWGRTIKPALLLQRVRAFSLYSFLFVVGRLPSSRPYSDGCEGPRSESAAESRDGRNRLGAFGYHHASTFSWKEKQCHRFFRKGLLECSPNRMQRVTSRKHEPVAIYSSFPVAACHSSYLSP